MAYVTPATSLQFYRDISLTPEYEDTLYFASASDRDAYFDGLSGNLIANVPNCTVQRENYGSCRVEVPISTLYHATYMRFRNTAFENKWYYAFVTAVNYVNNVTTEIEYQIDYMMTWMGDFVLFPCLVERETVYNDTVGSHTLLEGLSTGDYIVEGTEVSNNYGASNSEIRLIYADPQENGHMWGGIYNACQFIDSASADAITEQITTMVNADLTSNIVNIQMVPKAFQIPGTLQTDSVTFNKPYFNIAGYTPKNNKLYCYPYKFLRVDNSEGSQKDYRYEYFGGVPDTGTDTTQCRFFIRGVTANNVEITCEPYTYDQKNTEDVNDLNVGGACRITMTNFPQGAFAVDTYKAYLAQKNAYYVHDLADSGVQGFLSGLSGSVPSAQAGMGATAGTAGSAPTYTTIPTMQGRSGLPAVIQPSPYGSTTFMSSAGTPGTAGTAGMSAGTAALLNGAIGALTSMASTAASNLIDNALPAEAGTRLHGAPASDLMFSSNRKQFTFMEMSITPEYAKSIDEYFSMFGYKVNRVKTPSMNNREHWTYVKTCGCNIHGNIPALDLKILSTIFDSGIRFWKSVNEIGNYSLSNDPLG